MVNGRTKLEICNTQFLGCCAGLVASIRGTAAAKTASGLTGVITSATSIATRRVDVGSVLMTTGGTTGPSVDSAAESSSSLASL